MKVKQVLALVRLVLLATVALLILRPAAGLVAQESTPPHARRSAVYAPHGVVATSQPLASQAGLAVLERGGNAIDAAVTAAAVLNVVEPFATGLGGDMFAILWSARQRRLIGINASGRSGSLMTREKLLRRGHKRMPFLGAEPITVPGALSGWAVPASIRRKETRPKCSGGYVRRPAVACVL